MSFFASLKGFLGEITLVAAKKIYLDGDVYRDINNVTLRTPEGTTQIDHVIVSPYGIFVIETKNMEGWIFGDQSSPRWTQCIYGKKFRFQNPLHQNYRHIRALEQLLALPPEYFHSVVCFIGDTTELKTDLPSNVLCGGYFSYIKSKQQVLLSASQVTTIVDTIKAGMLPKNFLGLSTRETKQEHLASLRQRHASSSSMACPKCNGNLVLRTVKRGSSAGKQFYGCDQFPRCRFIRDDGHRR